MIANYISGCLLSVLAGWQYERHYTLHNHIREPQTQWKQAKEHKTRWVNGRRRGGTEERVLRRVSLGAREAKRKHGGSIDRLPWERTGTWGGFYWGRSLWSTIRKPALLLVGSAPEPHWFWPLSPWLLSPTVKTVETERKSCAHIKSIHLHR